MVWCVYIPVQTIELRKELQREPGSEVGKKSIAGRSIGEVVGSYCGWSGVYREYKVMSCYPGPCTVQSSQTSQHSALISFLVPEHTQSVDQV